MKRFIFLVFIILVCLPLTAQDVCTRIGSSSGGLDDDIPETWSNISVDWRYVYENGQLVLQAYGTILAGCSDPGSTHNCGARAQLYVERNGVIEKCYTTAEVEGTESASVQVIDYEFSITEADKPWGSLVLKGRTHVWGCFDGSGTRIYITKEESKAYYNPPIPQQPPTYPPVPTNLSVLSTSGPVVLGWTGDAQAAYYVVSRMAEDDGTWAVIGNTSNTVYTDNWMWMAAPNWAEDKYYYRVKAVNSAEYSSAYSSSVYVYGNFPD